MIPSIISENQENRQVLVMSYDKLSMIFCKLSTIKKRVNRELIKAEK
jgi:hypothetical protein